MWNNLSTKLRESYMILGHFRRTLKTHLFGYETSEIQRFRALCTNSLTYLFTYLFNQINYRSEYNPGVGSVLVRTF